MTKDELKETISLIPDLSISTSDHEKLVEALFPFMSTMDIVGKTFVMHIPMSGKLSDEELNRCYAYADWIRKLGAKNVLFLPTGSYIKTMNFKPEDIAILKFDSELPEADVVHKYLDWIRIAREGVERVVVLDETATLQKLTDQDLDRLGLTRRKE